MDEIHDELLNIYEEETGVRNFFGRNKMRCIKLKNKCRVGRIVFDHDITCEFRLTWLFSY